MMDSIEVVWQNQIMSTKPNPFSKTIIFISTALTILYWYWESQAEGNIRIDLLLIYPVLFVSYLICLWPRFKFYSLLIALGLMGFNIGFFIISYDLFNKHLG